MPGLPRQADGCKVIRTGTVLIMAKDVYAGEYNGNLLYVTTTRLEQCERAMALMKAVREATTWDEVLGVYPRQEVRDVLHAALLDAWDSDSGGNADIPDDYWPDLHDLIHYCGWIESIPKLDDATKLGDLPEVLVGSMRYHDTSAGTGYDPIYWDFADRERLDKELIAAGVAVRAGASRFAALLDLYETL